MAELNELERDAAIIASGVRNGGDYLAYYIYEIFYKKKWAEAKDDQGNQIYETQKDYIPVFQQKTQIARSVIFDYLKLAKIAFVTLGLSLDEFIQLGGIVGIRHIKDYVEIDSKFRLRSLPNVLTDDPIEYIKHVLHEANFDNGVEELRLSANEKRLLIKDKMGGKEPELTIYYNKAEDRVYAATSESKYVLIEAFSQIPNWIRSRLLTKLKAIDYQE